MSLFIIFICLLLQCFFFFFENKSPKKDFVLFLFICLFFFYLVWNCFPVRFTWYSFFRIKRYCSLIIQVSKQLNNYIIHTIIRLSKIKFFFPLLGAQKKRIKTNLFLISQPMVTLSKRYLSRLLECSFKRNIF